MNRVCFARFSRPLEITLHVFFNVLLGKRGGLVLRSFMNSTRILGCTPHANGYCDVPIDRLFWKRFAPSFWRKKFSEEIGSL